MLLRVNGVTYHLKIEGNGEPLVVLHGFTGSLKTWEPFLSEWSSTHKVICIDLLGHGKTESPSDSKRYTMENTVCDLELILDQLNIVRAHFLGYSMGGRVALSFAAMKPTRVISLLLESSSPGLKTEEEKIDRRKNDEKLACFIEEQGIPKFIDKWEDIPLFASQKRLPLYKKQEIRNERLMNTEVGLANSLRGMGTGSQPSWWSCLSSLIIPVCLIVGELDEKFCNIASDMKEILPNVKKVEVSDTGHAIHVECPEIFGKIVMEWLCEACKNLD